MRVKGKSISRQRRWQIKKEKQGLCNICGKLPIYRGKTCKIHYAMSQGYRRKYYKKHKDELMAYGKKYRKEHEEQFKRYYKKYYIKKKKGGNNDNK